MPDAATDEYTILPLTGSSSTGALLLLESSESAIAPDPFETANGPTVGGTVLGFELVCELGRGGFARVFLAREMALSDRLVVLKLSYRATGEAERLAQLRHSNVVPVYSVHRSGALQVICMPYFGRTTLADLLFAYHLGTAGEPGTEALAEPNVPNPVRDPAAVLRLLSGLAAGLQHAHERGILHLDIKPSNVLLVDTGEPLLFDFNLSLDGTRGDRDHIGGTKPYMSIEQMRDLAEHASARVDARSDLYSLGVTAFELLTGELPFQPVHGQSAEAFVAARRAELPSVRARNPAVSPAVEALVHKLLAADPADRYQTAAQLREDIELHLHDQQLKHAPNPSRREWFAKWQRRNPWLLARLAGAVALVLVLVFALVRYARVTETRRAEATESASDTARVLETVVRLDTQVHDPVANARGLSKGLAALAPYGLPGDARWRERPVLTRLSEDNRRAAAHNLGELMGLLAHAHWRTATRGPEGERRAAAEAAWELNVAARECFGPGAVPFLDEQAADIARYLGRAFEKPQPRACATVAVRALYLEAVGEMTRGRFGVAVEKLEAVVAAQPVHGAAQFALAHCRHQRGEHLAALERYQVAAELLREDPRPLFRRGQVLRTLGQFKEAEAAFTAALGREPREAEVLVHRALVRLRIARDTTNPKELVGAEEDVRLALECGAPPAFALSVRAGVRELAGDRAGARADRTATRARAPRSEQEFLARGWDRLASDPLGALADFRAAVECNPQSLEARYLQVQVLGERLGDTAGALAEAQRIVSLYPEFAPARAGRAVLLARSGHRADAHAEAEHALAYLSDANVTFSAACVYAITGRTVPTDRAVALTLLKRAVRKGFWDATRLASDPDLSALAGEPEMRAIRESVERLLR